MKKAILPLLALLLISLILPAQITYSPSCYSNADGWTIDQIETNDNGTYVYLSYYSYKANYAFYINPGMFIANYNDQNSAKYYVQELQNNQLNTTYSLASYQHFNFVLKFDRIPSDWTDINIQEPPVTGGNAWYWNYISLNKPSTERLKEDNFLVNKGIDFLRNFAHPLDDFKFSTYTVDYGSMRIAIYYDGYVTDLRIKYLGSMIYQMSILYDNDFIVPFKSIEAIRDFIQSQDNQNKYSGELEQYLNKTVSEMNGAELACVGLTILWNSK
jgi:hypothetical protein